MFWGLDTGADDDVPAVITRCLMDSYCDDYWADDRGDAEYYCA